MQNKIDRVESGVSGMPVDIGSRLELFVDRYVVEKTDNVCLKMHTPCLMPYPEHPLTGSYMTVLLDNGLYRGYYRAYKQSYTGQRVDGNKGECTCYAESRDGIEWEQPDLGIFTEETGGDKQEFTERWQQQDVLKEGLKNAILNEPPFSHNFSPFIDTRPGVPASERYKALAGTRVSGLYAFVSGDGIHWRKQGDKAAISYNEEIHGVNAFDSQNVAFWSEVEQCYVAYFRHFKTPQGNIRTISRATSPDFLNWTDESRDFEAPNLPGEELYVNQTHPYFRAPHIYIALPTRFSLCCIQGRPVEGNLGSTDIMFMTTRAGSNSYQRLFKETFIRPGPDPERWANRANYVALNVVQTGPAEMSIYNRGGQRYALRVDGFASANAPYDGGELITKPLIFKGNELALNVSTSIQGSVRAELQDINGKNLPGFGLDDCEAVVGDSIEYTVSWKGGKIPAEYEGQPVRIRFELRDSDIYSFCFRGGK